MAKRPIIWALLFLAAGILWGRYVGTFIPLGVIAAAACAILHKWLKYPPIFLCVLLALAGVLGVERRLSDGVVPAEGVEFYGIVQDMRYTRAGWQRLVVTAYQGIFIDIDVPETYLETYYGSYYRTSYRTFYQNSYRTSYQTSNRTYFARPGADILTFLSPLYRVEIGQRVRFTGDLQPLDGPRNPGAYNEFMVQSAHGINGKFFARSAENFEVNLNTARLTFIIRNRLAEVYDTVLPYRQSNLIQSVILGERPDMDDPVVDMFRSAGIYHLLVVSGLHLSILMMTVCLVLEKVFNKRAAGLTALTLMIGYTFLTGAGISTVRAVTMAGVAVFGRVLYRDRDALASCSFACITLLLYQPLYLFSIGFQLSFSTVFGLILLTGPMERALAYGGMPSSCRLFSFTFRKFRPFLAYNIIGTISTYPVLAYHFSHVSTYSILVNLIIMPTATLLVVVGILVGIVGLFSMGAAFFLAGFIYYLLIFYEGVMGFFLSLPGSVFLTGNWGLWVTLAAMAGMLAFGYAFSGYGENFYKRAKILILVAMVFLASIGFEAAGRRRLDITALDVGLPDISSYVIRAAGHSFVVDGGGNNRLLGMNTGVMVLMPYMDHRGISRADAAFVTDTSRQRIMGLIELAMADRVRVIYVPGDMNMDSGLGMRLRVAAERNNIPLYRLEIGDMVWAGPLSIIVTEVTPRMRLLVFYDDYEIWLI